MNKYCFRILALSAVFFVALFTRAQSNTDTTIYTIVEKMPAYTGGNDSLLKDITDAVVYPQACIDSGIHGKVYLRFVVNIDGSISHVHAVKSPNQLLSAAAIEATTKIKRFTPGAQQGKPVRVWYSVPVNFKMNVLENEAEELSRKNPGLVDSLDAFVAELERDSVFAFVDVMPEFPGGTDAMLQFLAKNTVYPEKERDNDIGGRVMLRFIINEEGNVENITVIRSASPGLDKEAIRVVSSFPRFKPGMLNGKPVKVYYNLPVVFRLGHSIGFDKNTRKNLYDYFQGGFSGFSDAIQNDLIFPERAKAQKLEAKISVMCKLTDMLTLEPVEVLNDIDSIFTSEAMRLIKLAKPFNPEIRQSDLMNQTVRIVIEFIYDKRHRCNGSGGPDASAANGYVRQGADYYSEGKYAKAIEQFDAAIRYYSVHPDAYYNRALTYYKLNDIKSACDDFKQAYLLGLADAKKGMELTCQ